MIILDCEQHSDEWFNARLGIPTGSCFDKIITSQDKPASGQKTYMNELLAEWLVGAPVDTYTSVWMERGNELENEARSYYEFKSDNPVKQVGLVFKNDKNLVSCSPDGLIDGVGGLEIKCPKANTQIEYLLTQKLPAKYVPQVQGSMWITEREWWDFLSYHPDMPPLLVRVYRDDNFINSLETKVNKFIETMLEKRETLLRMGYSPNSKEAT